MTAIRNIDVLRAAAEPSISLVEYDRAGPECAGFGEAPEPVRHCPARRPRSVLAARWHMRRDRRLACRRQADTSAAPGLPPD